MGVAAQRERWAHPTSGGNGARRSVQPRLQAAPPSEAATSFSVFDLPDFLLRAVDTLGFDAPTAVQGECLPVALLGRDLVVQAQTGSGKTLAFALPIVAKLGTTACANEQPRALVLVPTRELAVQVAATFKACARYSPSPIQVLAVLGGEDIERQQRRLRAGVDILIATPGRLLDLLDRGDVALAEVRTLVLDEADKLLDLGFEEELQRVVGLLQQARQTLLVSATLPDSVVALASTALHDPVTIRISEEAPCVDSVHQRVLMVDADKRRGLLLHLLQAEGWKRVLVFVASRRAAQNLSRKLRREGLRATELHGGLEQEERLRAVRAIKSGSARVVVATDLAARGLDIPELSAVINFDLPRTPSDYIHRIGRTGRAGAHGVAISFIDHASAPHFALIERRCRVTVPREQLADFALSGAAPARKRGGAPIKGKRKSKKDKLREQRDRTS